MANSDRSKPMIRSNAATASAQSWSNTPAVIHSSRRARKVVSETRCSRMASMSTHDEPVVSRIRIPQKQSWSGTRGRWHPSGCSGGLGSSGSMAAKTASTTSVSSARMMWVDLPGRCCRVALGMKTEPSTDRWMVTIRRLPARVLSRLLAVRARRSQLGVPAGVVPLRIRLADLDLKPAVSSWGGVFGDQAVAAAMIDRIVYHVDVLTLKGAGHRLRDRSIDTLDSIRATADDPGNSVHQPPHRALFAPATPRSFRAASTLSNPSALRRCSR